MTLRLIVNSDDYCRTPGVSRGIREAHLRGVVSSTSCMMNFPNSVADVVAALHETPRLGLGVHLVLTSGRPLLPPSQIPDLTSADGDFLKLDAFEAGLHGIDPAQAKLEWRSQIEKFVRTAGRAPTHLDSHHHSSYFTEDLFRAMLELAQEYGCATRQVVAQGESDELNGLPAEVQGPIREYGPRLMAEFAARHPDRFYASFYDTRATKEDLLRIIVDLPAAGTAELMCHPGYADEALMAGSIYNRQRERELAILTDREVREAIDGRGIRLVSFAALE